MTALLVAAALLAYAGFACLALAMPDHRALLGDRAACLPSSRLLRLLAACLLGGAYAVCLWRDGGSFGSLLWLVLISAAGLAVAFTLTWRVARR